MLDDTSSGDDPTNADGQISVTMRLDVGAENCATLILNVRQAMQALASGEVLEVVAYDPSAQLDLMAWSRMTGHTFLGTTEHDDYATYYLRKRGN